MSEELEDAFKVLLQSAKVKPKIIKNSGVIIQARMTSKRFPGKTMAFLNGKPILEHVISRCHSPRVEKIIIAVPDTPESEPMLELADRMGISNFCGSENNVLDRFYRAALFHNLRYIVRITADCPFVLPVLITESIELLVSRKLDYVSNVHPVRTFQKGLDVEAFTFDALEAAFTLAESEYDKEHVTSFMQRNVEFKKSLITQKKNLSEENLCVDWPHDIERLESYLKKKKAKMQ